MPRPSFASIATVISLLCSADMMLASASIAADGARATEFSDQNRRDRPTNGRPSANRPRPPGARPPTNRPRPPAARPNRPRPPVAHRPAHRRWARPARYSWRPGGAIAAGAAMGFLAAANAAWAGPPPAAGLCWYYTDWTQRNGFWDWCP